MARRINGKARAEERKRIGVPGPGVEERSDEAPGAGAPAGGAVPDPEVLAKPTRRQFTAEYRLRILEEADRCGDPGGVGRLLRREGLYSSHLSNWRKARQQGALSGLRPKKRGRKPSEANPLAPKVRSLEAKVKRLERELAAAHTILDVQFKTLKYHPDFPAGSRTRTRQPPIAGPSSPGTTPNTAMPASPCSLLKPGVIVIDRDRRRRMAWEVKSRNEYFDMEPIRRLYRHGPSS